MIKELFRFVPVRKNNGQGVDLSLKYSEDFVKFLIINQFFDKEYVNILGVKKFIRKKYYENNMNVSSIENFIKKNFDVKNDEVIIEDEDKEIFKKIYKIYNEYKEGTLKEIDVYYKEFCEYFFRKEIDTENIIKLLINIYCVAEKKTIEELCYVMYMFFKNYSNNLEIVKSVFPNEEYINKKIGIILNDSVQENILIFIGIDKIKEFFKLSAEKILILFFKYNIDLKKCFTPITISKNCYEEELQKKVDLVLKEREKEIIFERYQFGYIKTLNEVGEQYGVTRERVRQIEERVKRKINTITGIEAFLILICNFEERQWCEINEILNKIDNVELKKFINFYINISENDEFFLDTRMNILVQKKGENTIDSIIMEYEENMPDFIMGDNINNLNVIEKFILDKKYSMYKTMYRKKSLGIVDLYCKKIVELFPDGFKVSDDEQFNRLKESLENEYGIEFDGLTVHNIIAQIARKDFILINNGTYIHRDRAAILPITLREKILEYIEKYFSINNNGILYYKAIFEMFEEELTNYGIDNRFYLKGLLDEWIQEKYDTKRDFLAIGIGDSIAKDFFVDVLKSFKGYFSLEEVKEKIPGLELYTYKKFLNNEYINGLIPTGEDEYVYIEYKNISIEDITKIQNCIEGLFKSLNETVITSRKIYSRLRLFNPELVEKLELRNGHIELYYIIQNIFKNDYYFSRPFISKEKDFANTFDEIIESYLSKLDDFTISDIQNYIDRMNLRNCPNWSEFIKRNSDEFVWINMERMVRKEKMYIQSSILEYIKRIITVYIDNMKCIDTRTFNAYSNFPKVGFEWNKYLLIGIIRTYFDNLFDVEATELTYKISDYIIRRKK